ncbi:MAG TPA: hypothetical protein VE988_17435 [Gemmataceae bacterium]|nr:hypothetical protein [Gemmataceae bacterium]
MAAQDPGRGTLILVLGILGFVCCGLLAPVAWIMGKQDMAKIQAGQIAPEAEQLTKIGMILGMIGTALIILYIIGGCIFGIITAIAGSKVKTALDVYDAIACIM